MPNLSPPPAFIANQSWWPTEEESWLEFKNHPASHKELVNTIRDSFTTSFREGAATSEVVIGYAITMDYLLWYAWFTHDLHKTNATLLAVGGYGRAELHLYSDIDLLILVDNSCSDEFQSKLTHFLTFLWDSGLDIGHSVRTVKQTVAEAKKDITVITSILEARPLCGNIALYNNLKKATAPKKIWNSKQFYLAKKEELLARHRKYGDTFYQLEPNIKEGPGGLRDIQFIDWITKRHFDNRSLGDLISTGFLTEVEYNHLRHAQEYLWKIRFSLHVVTQRKEERLLFDHQIQLARESGYNNLNSNLAVEQFMQNYYRHISECSQLTELLSAHFEETYLTTKFFKQNKPINNRFAISGDTLCVAHDNVFKQNSMALLELFLLMQQNERLKKVSSHTIRLVHQNLHLIDQTFREDIRNRSIFIEILRQPKHIARELKRMHRFGVLAAYWPAFARIVGRMQYDLYHVYTVDHHILTVLQEARQLSKKDVAADEILSIFNQLPKPELLYLAALFHDVAKGRKGDHSTEGSNEALTFCLEHGLSEYDAKLVAWLVENHLEMSMTAQHKDTSDPEIVNEFAEKVTNLIRLNYLYLLTIADINGTNPALWNNWRATLLAELYKSTAAQLRSDNPINNDQQIIELKKSALKELAKYGHDETTCVTYWEELDDDYFIRHTDDEIAWHTHSILNAKDTTNAQVKIRQLTNRGCTEIFIYSGDRRHLFSNITRCLHDLGLSILDARVITSKKGHVLDTFIVLNDKGQPITDTDECEKIETQIQGALVKGTATNKQSNRYIPRRLRHFRSPPKVSIVNTPQTSQTCVHIWSTDYPGLLADLADVFAELDLRIHSARVSTLGERVHDIFDITTGDNQKINEQAQQELTEKIISRTTLSTKSDT